MTRKQSRFTAVLASAAALAMTATPAMAQGWGWGGGWGRHHRDRVDAGDVLTGILIIGGIAAIASAASNSSKRDRDRRRDDDRRYPDEQYRRDSNAGYGQDNRPEWREREGTSSGVGGGIDGAVNACIDEVARGSARVDGVDAVNREGKGWRVQGQTIKGGTFVCSVDGSGRVTEVSVDGKAY
ncbi:MAG: hypothetical protein C0515_02995 [Novosphingobium sp.]|nr:hypothetical protein [Novosphingobium sp.]